MQATEYFNDVLALVVKHYDLGDDAVEFLRKEWELLHPKKQLIPTEELDFTELSKLKVVQLKSMCSSRNLPVSGTKATLISRLLGKETEPAKKTKKKYTYDEKVAAKILTTMASDNRAKLSIRRNVFGNYEHIDTQFVFDRASDTVIGKQTSTVEVAPLTADDIELCKEYGFKYVIPPNLETAN